MPPFGESVGQDPGKADRDLATARKVLDSGNLPHAAVHVSNALVAATLPARGARGRLSMHDHAVDDLYCPGELIGHLQVGVHADDGAIIASRNHDQSGFPDIAIG
jgi:hypothetical protein